MATRGNFNIEGSRRADIVVVTDLIGAPTYQHGDGLTMTHRQKKMFEDALSEAGISPSTCAYIIPAPPLPEICVGSEKRTSEFLKEHREEFLECLSLFRPKLIIYHGKYAGQQLAGRSIQITKVRGQVAMSEQHDVATLATVSPRHVMRRPENLDEFKSDLHLVKMFKDAGWDFSAFDEELRRSQYDWAFDLEPLLDDMPRGIAADTETVGNKWYAGARLLTVQLSYDVGTGIMIPFDRDYYNSYPSFLITDRDEIREEMQSLEGRADLDAQWLERHLQSLQREERRVQKRIDEFVPMTKGEQKRVQRQTGQVFASPVRVIGHNFKFDMHILRSHGIEVNNWFGDTMQLAFNADENMENKGLDDCIRRWVPAMAGYADEFNRVTDKSRMDLVHPDNMLQYGCGDTDGVLRLFRTLWRIVSMDPKQLKCYELIQMPGLRTFFEMERKGLRIDKQRLRELQATLNVLEAEQYRELIKRVPPQVKRAHLNDPRFQKALERKQKTPAEVLAFSRDEFVRDIMFSDKGFNFEPIMFTDSTAKLGPEHRLAATSKDHLAYFQETDLRRGVTEQKAEFVLDLIQYQGLQKMRTTYVGTERTEEIDKIKVLKSGTWPKPVVDSFNEAGIPVPPAPQTIGSMKRGKRRVRIKRLPKPKVHEWQLPPVQLGKNEAKSILLDSDGSLYQRLVSPPKGFWQYLQDNDDYIHPSFFLHRAVTGRTSSSDPNAQNLPKHGDLARQFRRIFIPPPGWVFLEADLSQIELRIAAWMAKDKAMLEIYQQGGDIHSFTASALVGVRFQEFLTWKDDVSFFHDPVNPDIRTKKAAFKHYRFLAKAVNFGFLYGQWWTGFKVYARTDFGVKLTDAQAKEFRELFFKRYSGLEQWHKNVKAFANKHEFVRALHGAVRHLPSVNSVDEGIQKSAERQAVNSPVQRFASDMGVMAMNRFNRDCPWDRMYAVAFIHDALIICAREDSWMEAAGAGKFYMETNPLKRMFGIEPPLPIVADVTGPGYDLDMEDLPDIEGLQSVQPSWYRRALDLRVA